MSEASELVQAWPMVVAFMRRRCGLQLREDQAYLLSARLVPLARSQGYDSILRFVTDTVGPNASSHAVVLMVDAMTTHETSFFRDAGFWEAFEQRIVPHLVDCVQRNRSACIWSAACSTGQEAYTVAMLLEEVASAIAPFVRILGTDVSALTTARARDGIYTQVETGRGLSARRLARHFAPAPGGVQIKAGLRQRVSWETQNLLGTPPFAAAYDVVLCRNVLIYFDTVDRNTAIERLYTAVRPDGFVGVGTTELLSSPLLSPGWYAARARAAPAQVLAQGGR